MTHACALPQTQEYLPITGDPVFCRLARQLALGADCPAIQQGRVSTVQSLSGVYACMHVYSVYAQHLKVPTV